ncbi:MAG: hypothetical protein AAFO01_22995, partial [Pseudomonadota bacterium]
MAESLREWASYQLFYQTLKERLRAVRPFCALSPGLDFEYGHLIERLDDAARIMQPRANKAANGTASARVATGSSVGSTFTGGSVGAFENAGVSTP